MRVGVIGGGPAGLYFALLMRQADPVGDIEVVERNPPDATFGWGVVFSQDTLGELRDADHETFVRLSEELVRWEAIDIFVGDSVVRAGGQGFSGISRKVMLRILQERCRELGVGLHFEREVDDLRMWSDRDLIVAADGVNSWTRRRYEPAFRTRALLHPTRYAWFGTDLVFDAFTFIFRETEWGLFQVHAYPFSAEMSTFIVETTEETWSAAGLDRLSEAESLAFCQSLFAEELGSHRLYSNRSDWINFVTLSCEAWHHDNIVLVGDAAHTAHFSIGSGTKLAVEDAVALVQALREHPTDLAAAFAAYELERQPPVRRFQEAAAESSSYFEHAARYLSFPPEQFAFSLLTRSGRITHRSLELRDPMIVAATDRRLFEAGSEPSWIVSPPPRLAPLHLGDVTLPNRLVLIPPPSDSAVDGVPGSSHSLEAAAGIGAGMIVTEATAVSAEGRVTDGSPGLYEDHHVAAWERILHDVYAQGVAAVALRLVHAGRRGSTRPRRRGTDRPLAKGWPVVAPSPVSYTARSAVPKQLDEDRMAAILGDFEVAAQRADLVGFDLLIIDAGTGYLLGSFLSPLTNHRDDRYGGDLHGRLRWPLEVVQDVREQWPGPLGARIAATDWTPEGTQPEEAVAIAVSLAAAGVDLIEVAGGQTAFVASPDYRRRHLVPLADQVRNEAGVVTMVGGSITTFDEVDTIVGGGRADLCVLDPVLYERSPIRERVFPP